MKWAKAEGKATEDKYKTMFTNFDNAYKLMSTVSKEFYYKIYSVVLMPTGNFLLDFNQVESLFGEGALTGDERVATIEAINASAETMWDGMHYDTEVKKLVLY